LIFFMAIVSLHGIVADQYPCPMEDKNWVNIQPTINRHALSWEECGDMCNDDTNYPDCQRWEYWPNTTENCFMQWDVPGDAGPGWAICGDRNCHSVKVADQFDCPMEDTYWSEDFKIAYNVHTWEECSDICFGDPNCLFWNYFINQHYYQQCVTNWYEAIHGEGTGKIAGLRNCHS